jgi:Lantibiotic dehydratase, N terminus
MLPLSPSNRGRWTSAKYRQVRRGVLRYLARASMKAVPFGAFAVVLPAAIVTSNSKQPKIDGVLRPQHRQTRINDSLFCLVWRSLVEDVDTSALLPLEVADSELADFPSSCRRVLAERKGIEQVTRIKDSQALTAFLGRLQARPLSLTQLCAEFAEREADTDRVASFEQFVATLRGAGVLRYVEPKRGEDSDWTRSLCQLVDSVDTAPALKARALMRALSRLRGCLAEADLQSRSRILHRVRQELTQWLPASTPATERRAVLGLPIVEDATANARLVVPLDGVLGAALSTLASVAESILPIGSPRCENFGLRELLNRHCGGRPTPLLEFYEIVAREYFKGAHAESGRRNGAALTTSTLNGNPFGLASCGAILATRHAIREWLHAASQQTRNAREIALSSTELSRITQSARHFLTDHASATAFVAVASNDGAATLILQGGKLLSGYGKYFSRFAQLLPAGFAATVRRRNGERTTGEIVDLLGPSVFSGDFRTQLTDRVLRYPTSAHYSRAAGTLTCGDVIVAPARDNVFTVELLERATQQPLTPVDLGVLSHRFAPALQQILACFAPFSSYSFPADAALSQSNGIVRHRRRVSVDGCLVLAREQWTVDVCDVPRRGGQESPSAFLQRVWLWRDSHGIPSEVFFRLRRPQLSAPSFDVPATLPAARERAEVRMPNAPSREWEKPQYLDFSSAEFVELLGAAVNGLVMGIAIFEEALPNAGDRSRSWFLDRSAELVLQIDVPPR